MRISQVRFINRYGPKFIDETPSLPALFLHKFAEISIKSPTAKLFDLQKVAAGLQ